MFEERNDSEFSSASSHTDSPVADRPRHLSPSVPVSAPTIAPTEALAVTPVEVDSAEETVNDVLRPKSAMAEERAWLLAQFHPSRLQWKNADWVVFLWMTSMHLGALAAVVGLCVPALRAYTFSWTALGVGVFLHWLTCSIGICLGYHRGLSHRSFILKPPVRFLTLVAGY